MRQDLLAKSVFGDNYRFADLVNVLGCGGRQVVQAADLQDFEKEGKTGKRRDLVRKAAFGMHFAVIGLENQEKISYLLPLRIMEYEADTYRLQADQIRSRLRANPKELDSDEYLYGFKKESRLAPSVTFVLYFGKKPWDGAVDLHGILDFSEIPEELQELVQNYRVYVIEVRNMTDTDMFRTDIRQIFDLIRYAEDKERLLEVVNRDSSYRSMDSDVFDFAAKYMNVELYGDKENYRTEEGRIDMCGALEGIRQDGILKGIEIGEVRGAVQGERKGILDGILEFLCDLGEIPDGVNRLLQSQTDLDILRRWLKLAARAVSVDAFYKEIQKSV